MSKINISKKELKRLYITKRFSSRRIAKILSCSQGKIYYLLKRYKIKIRQDWEKIEIPKKDLENLYIKKDLSSYDIAKIYKCGPTIIQKRLKEHKIPLIHKREKIEIPKDKLYDLYIKKVLSTYKIAKLYKCGNKTIYRRLKEHHIKTRPRKVVYIPKRRLINLYVKNKLSLSKISKLYNCSNSIIFNKLKKHSIKRRDKFESHRKYERKLFNGKLTEKAYLIGFRLGDLSAKKLNERTVRLKSNTTMIEQANLIKSLFSNYGHVYIKEKNGVYWTGCSLHENFNFLVEKKDKVYDWILKDNKIFFAFLGGYTDAEGNIGVYNNMAKYRVGSYDKNILFQIYKNLNKLGIKATYNLETKKGIYGNRKHNGDFYRVNVMKMASLTKLFRQIKQFIKHEKRYKDLLKAEQNIIERINRNGKILHYNTNLLCKRNTNSW